ncbi:flagellar biosynthetic protein FliO [Cupriavidus pauculus]|jgi:flagellar protein FliO/FliZ
MTAVTGRPFVRRPFIRRVCAGALSMASVAAHAADALVLSTASAASSVAASPASHGAAPAISTGGSLAQAGLGLFGVIALILAIAWIARRTGLVRHTNGGGAMKVVGSLMLGARQRLVMVEVGDTWIVLGVSAGEIRPLHTMPAPADRAAHVYGSTSGTGTQPPHGMSGSFAERLLRSMQENLKKS